MKRNDWMGIPGYSPDFVTSVSDLRDAIAPIFQEIGGNPVHSILVGYDTDDESLWLDLPVLLEIGNHVVDIANLNFNEVTVGIDRIDPKSKVESVYGNWNPEWKPFPFSAVHGQVVLGMEPSVEEEEKYMNHGCLNGVSIELQNGLLLIENGLDTNLLEWREGASGERKIILNGA